MDPAPDYEGVVVTPDGLQLLAQGWQPEAPPRALVAVVHGLAEHGGRYARLGRALARHGFALHTYDQRGHGRSDGRRAYVAAFDRYLDDLAVFLASLRARFPGVPLFLLGHSMGGAVVTRYVLERADEAIQGLILSSPALRLPSAPPKALRGITALAARLFPYLPTLAIDRQLLSHDPAEVEKAQTDPLNFHGRIPARTGAELVEATARIAEQMETLKIPLLAFHGTADEITDPAGTEALYDRAASADKMLHLYDGLYHETLNETEADRARVFRDLLAWLEERVEG